MLSSLLKAVYSHENYLSWLFVFLGMGKITVVKYLGSVQPLTWPRNRLNCFNEKGLRWLFGINPVINMPTFNPVNL